MLDEIDKLGSDFRGDPASALLEVLDPEQNNTFRDHYLDVPFDLSEVIFITTANVLDPIPPPLRDRMEVIELAGYTEEEKLKIARDTCPKQVKNHGLTPEQIELHRRGRRAGHPRLHARGRRAQPRARDRRALPQGRARRRAEGDERRRRRSRRRSSSRCSARRASSTRRSRSARKDPGVAIGLAWTPVGGDVLFVEATRMQGGGSLTLTGHLGDVMKESARAALSWFARAAHAATASIRRSTRTADIHIHVPAGAIPKDGPSAGVTMATALVSALTGRPVRGDLAMTGEITLSGKVLPVGGIKEKVLAARRAGIARVILPRQNEKSVREDIGEELRHDMKIHLVSTIEEVLDLALLPPVKQIPVEESTNATVTTTAEAVHTV